MSNDDPPTTNLPKPRAGRRLLKIVGVVAVCSVAMVGTCVGVIAYHGRELDRSSQAFVDDTIPEILRTWDVDKLVAISSPEMLGAAPRATLQNLFEGLDRKLGHLTELHESKGDTNMSYMNGQKTITAAYRIEGQFEKASAQIDLRIIRHGDKWQVLGFHVESDALLK